MAESGPDATTGDTATANAASKGMVCLIIENASLVKI
jgi:hypothetical protein